MAVIHQKLNTNLLITVLYQSLIQVTETHVAKIGSIFEIEPIYSRHLPTRLVLGNFHA